MPARQRLRAVTPADAPVPSKSVSEAAKAGSTRELLVAMRDRIAVDVENKNTPARDLAALTKRLMEVHRDIEAIDARAEQEAERASVVEDGTFDSSAV